MNEAETTIIPLDDAHAILSTFGIDGTSPGYQRWRRTDGFRFVDFMDVLSESTLILEVDWREWLQDAADVILQQLQQLGIAALYNLGEEGERGTLQVGGKAAPIKYVPADGDDFDAVMASVNQLIDKTSRYRKLRCCEGTDVWAYAVLKHGEWRDLEATAHATMKLIFV